MNEFPKSHEIVHQHYLKTLSREFLSFIFEDISRTCLLSLVPRLDPNFVYIHGLAVRDVCINLKILQLITTLKQNNTNPHQPVMRNSGKSTELEMRKSNFWRRFATN